MKRKKIKDKSEICYHKSRNLILEKQQFILLVSALKSNNCPGELKKP